jgi:hypothetical protein
MVSVCLLPAACHPPRSLLSLSPCTAVCTGAAAGTVHSNRQQGQRSSQGDTGEAPAQHTREKKKKWQDRRSVRRSERRTQKQRRAAAVQCARFGLLCSPVPSPRVSSWWYRDVRKVLLPFPPLPCCVSAGFRRLGRPAQPTSSGSRSNPPPPTEIEGAPSRCCCCAWLPQS